MIPNQLFVSIPQNSWYTKKVLKNIENVELINLVKKNIEKANIADNSDNLGKSVVNILNGKM